jgi:hypothetical protein
MLKGRNIAILLFLVEKFYGSRASRQPGSMIPSLATLAKRSLE